MKTLHFQSVFVGGCGTAAGPMEAQGPLKDKIDKLFDDIYCEEKTYEQAERRLMSEACDHALRACLLYTSPSPRDRQKSRMPSSA